MRTLHILGVLLIAALTLGGTGPAKRRISIEDRLAGCGGPAVHAAQASISLHGSHRARIELVMDQVAAVAVQVDPFGELVRDNKHVRAEGAVKD